MRSEPIEFNNAAGHRIAARLDRPDGTTRAYALFAHCFTCDKGSVGAIRISRALAAEGIAVLRFDFTGLGESEGSFGESSFGTNIDDLVAAAAYLRGLNSAPSIMIGHSLGGAAVLAAAEKIKEVKALVVIGAPFSVSHVTHLFADHLDAIARDGRAEVRIGDRPFLISQRLVEGLQNQDQKTRIADLRRALLVMHSPTDKVVGIENAGQIFDAAKHPKSFVSLDDADHLLTRAQDAAYVAKVIAGWSSRYVGAAVELDKSSDTTVQIAETGAGKFQVEVTAGQTNFFADEPIAVGGLASGPTPYQLLSAGLGACTAMTLRLYAEQKQLPLKRVYVSVRHRKSTEVGFGDIFTRELTLEGPLDSAQRNKLIEIAEKCPVHRTLSGRSLVKTNIVAAQENPVLQAASDDHYNEMNVTCRDKS